MLPVIVKVCAFLPGGSESYLCVFQPVPPSHVTATGNAGSRPECRPNSALAASRPCGSRISGAALRTRLSCPESFLRRAGQLCSLGAASPLVSTIAFALSRDAFGLTAAVDGERAANVRRPSELALLGPADVTLIALVRLDQLSRHLLSPMPFVRTQPGVVSSAIGTSQLPAALI